MAVGPTQAIRVSVGSDLGFSRETGPSDAGMAQVGRFASKHVVPVGTVSHH